MVTGGIMQLQGHSVTFRIGLHGPLQILHLGHEQLHTVCLTSNSETCTNYTSRNQRSFFDWEIECI